MGHIVTLPKGFQVRFNLRGPKYDSKTFSTRAEAEAFSASLPTEPSFPRKLQRNNSSGMSGIRFEWRTYKSGNPHPTLVVSYQKNGKARMTSISLNKYGMEEALNRALELRGEKEKLPGYLRLIHSALKA